MSQLIPETLTRLQATMFVSRLEIIRSSSISSILYNAAKALVERGMEKILKDCITVEDDHGEHPGKIVRLDVYVLSPDELHKLIAEARMQGERDALKYRFP